MLYKYLLNKIREIILNWIEPTFPPSDNEILKAEWWQIRDSAHEKNAVSKSPRHVSSVFT